MSDLSVNRNSPVNDFTSGDFEGLKADLITYAQSKFSDRWTNFNDSEWAIVFLELLCYLGDTLSYQIDASIRETFATTALRRQNLINIAKGLDYSLRQIQAATGSVRLTLDPAGTYPFSVLKTDQYSNGATGDSQVIFQPDADVVVSAYGGGTFDVDVTEGEYFETVLVGVSNGNTNQRWQFPQDGVVPNTVALTVGAAAWTQVTSFVASQATSRHYKIVSNDDGNTFVLFGDGSSGAVPSLNSQIRATFRVGGGRRGNLFPNVVKTKLQGSSYILSVTNPEKMSGGDDAQTMRSARNSIPASLNTLNRAVTSADYEQVLSNLAGVAHARSGPGLTPGSRIVRAWIAPNGGGAPSSSLLTAVGTAMASKKMINETLKLYPPVYRDLRFEVLLHVNEGFRPTDVETAVRKGITALDGTGMLDFTQLDFSGVTKDANNEETLLLGQTRLQAYFDSCKVIGLDRAEIMALTALPLARARPEGNTGDGSVTGITLTSRQRRREFFIQLISAAQYAVYERIVGYVTSLSDSELTDQDKVFENEGIDNFGPYNLVPARDQTNTLPVLFAEGQTVTVAVGQSLFALTAPKTQYYLYNRFPTILSVGAMFTSADGNVSFTLTAGAAPFVAGDAFTLDTYPLVSDIRLRDDEYPQLSSANFVTRTSGGARV